MVADDQARRELDGVVRGLASASKALRLYPPTSPIPREAVEAAAASLQSYLASEPVLSLTVGREGLLHRGEPVAPGSPGAVGMAEDLRAHGVAEIDLTPGCSADDLIGFLAVMMRDPGETQAAGGVAAMLVSAGVEAVRAVDVRLTVLEEEALSSDEDIDDFFRSIAADEEKLASWLAAIARRDPSALSDGLAELVAAAGEGGMEALASNLAAAFKAQDPAGKDALFGAAMGAGAQRDISARAFEVLAPGDLASALTGGLYGRNMLSLSNAMTELPLGERLSRIMDEVRDALPQAGHTVKEADFLAHMIEVRTREEPESALADADETYRTVARLAEVSESELEQARTDMSSVRVSSRAVGTMLALLDEERDHALFERTVNSLASMVPALVEEGDLALAAKVLSELHARGARAERPWPDLDGMIRSAVSHATGKRTMAAVLSAVVEDGSLLGPAREIAKLGGDGSDAALAEEAIALKDAGVVAAEKLVGRRVIDMLVAAAPAAQWFQLRPIVARLAMETEPRAAGMVRQLASRPDEQSRREVAQGLAAAGTPAGIAGLASLARDTSAEVSIIAVRALAKAGGPDAARALSELIGSLDVDGRDFALAREVIGALAKVDDPSADATLAGLVSRRTLIRRGHFTEVQELARQAIEFRAKRGGVR